MQAHDYQRDAGNACVADLRKHSGVICSMATGTGKTATAWMIAEYFTKLGVRVLFLANREKLIEQAVASLKKFTGIECGIEKAESSAHNYRGSIVVGSIQSLTKERLEKYDRNAFGLLILDECHTTMSDMYLRVFEYFRNAKRLGFTATAYRHDSKSLMDVYDRISYEYTLKQAIKDGRLCRIVSEPIPIDCDLHELKYSDGDYSAESVASTITPVLSAIAEKMTPKLLNRHKTIAFLPLIKTSMSAAELFCGQGIACKHVAGESEDREDIIDWFEKDSRNLLCNPMFLSVGYDHPPIDTVLWLRPTTSTLSYTQAVGRGTRLHPGKNFLYLPDLIMNGESHDLCKPACLIAESAEVEDEMNAMSGASGGFKGGDILDLEQDAHEVLVDRREAKLAKHIKEFKGQKRGTYDPVLGTMALNNDVVSDWKPRVSGEAQSASGEQVRQLEEWGFDPTGWKSGYADEIIKLTKKRIDSGLATPKQLRLLCRQHVKGADKMTSEQAKIQIEKLPVKWKKIAQWKQSKKG